MLPGTRSKNKNLNVTLTHTCIILQILLNYVKSMNESDTFNNINSKYRCWTCLGTDDMIQSASIEETIWYQNNVKILQSNDQLYLCKYCKWKIDKLLRFIRQCHLASEMVWRDLKKERINFPYLATKPIEHHDLGSDDIEDDNYDIFRDEDDLPLLMMKSDEPEIELEPHGIKVEIKNEIEVNSDKVRKNDKEKRFSSRMVKETSEYVVIKLTKDEVLAELKAKSECEEYLRAPYKCVKCVKWFNFEDVLNGHIERHTPEYGAFQCDMCQQYCPSAVSLRGHIKSHTTRYKCKVCGYVRSSRQHLLEHHSTAHTDAAPGYTCHTCRYTTNKRTVMQRHVKTHLPSERHACHQCGKLFKTIDSLRVHAVRHDKSRRYQCSECEKAFIYPSLLHKHVQAVHERDDYYCVECDVKFKSPETLRLHFKKAKKHRDFSSYRYQCPNCDARFVSPSALAVHLSAQHGAAKLHACDLCHRRYSSREALRAHVWRTHTQREKSVTCDICEKSFSRKSVLKLHLRTHTGARPHACECGAAFAQKATLKAHAAAKHKKKDIPNEHDPQMVQTEQ
ncbi:oocyte zinc finger protein XlCOF6-like [Bombyx mandarina]|uniref:Oocyte zinc finger protein XlCOF6-like n=1 Tax=Bombyx mandarina TaxID=7092 RepID=A0A6J2KID9_BOMMA|nr:oocyte zinc finger protein XlCOF6-like [Bombyx mandarina]